MKWHSDVEAAKADAKDIPAGAYRIVEHVIEDREIDFPVVWYRCESRTVEKVWRNDG